MVRLPYAYPKSGRIEWLTPPEIVKGLSSFDLDPCAPVTRPWPTADVHFTVDDDGLSQSWSGRVWLNPPYGTETWKWMDRLAEHGNGIALIFARTETEGFHRTVWERATGILFFRGRLHFHEPCGRRANGNAGGPSVLIAYGQENARAIETAGFPGRFIWLQDSTP